MPNPTVRASATALPISSLIRDPMVRAAFLRAERDNGQAFAVTTPRPPVLSGGAANKREMANV
jgi:hypothetical protein